MNERLPRCSFYVRTMVSDEPLSYVYDQVVIRTAQGGTSLQLRYPPSIGDLILLNGETEATKGMFRVVDRAPHSTVLRIGRLATSRSPGRW